MAYTFLFADLMTNTILAELPLNGVSFENKLNAAGSFAGQLSLGDPAVAALDPFGSTQPGRTAIFVDSNGRLVWGGILWTRRFDSNNLTLEFGGLEFWSYWAHRIIFSNDIFLAQDQVSLTQALITTFQAVPGGNIGIQAGRTVFDAAVTVGSLVVTSPTASFTTADVGSWVGGAGIQPQTTIVSINSSSSANMSQPAVAMPLPALINNNPAIVASIVPPGPGQAGCGIAVDQPFYDYQLLTVDALVNTLSSVRQGFDYDIDISYDSTGKPAKYLTLSYPRRGASYLTGTGLVFDLPGNILHYVFPEDGTKMANFVRTNAVGYGGTQMFGSAADTSLLDSGWPLLELPLSLKDQSSQAVINQWTGSQLDTLRTPVVLPQLDVDPTQDPLLGSYTVGDECRVRINDQRFPIPLDTFYRITAIKTVPQESQHDMVTITLSNPFSG